MTDPQWEELFGSILGVIGVGSTSVAMALGCGGTVEDTGQTGAGTAGTAAAGRGGSGGAATGGGPSTGGFGNAGISTGGSLNNSTGGAPATGGTAGAAPGFLPAPPPGAVSCESPGFREIAVNPLPAACIAGSENVYHHQGVCFAPAADGSPCEAVYDRSCLADYYLCGFSGRASHVCGPLPEIGDACCYILGGDCPIGRPFFVAREARTARIEAGAGWSASIAPDVTALDADTRAALADAWAREGAAEHASVASFARFTMQCLALGAPAELVRGAQRAGLDEVEHARIAFALASAYAGRSLRPGRLDVAGALDDDGDLVTVATSLAREACVGETVSVLLIGAARDESSDPVVRDALTRILEEEREHVLLGWRALRWALDAGDPQVRAAVADVFARAEDAVGLGAVTELRGSVTLMKAHGYLPLAERRAVALRAVREIVAPAARALLRNATPASLTTALV